MALINLLELTMARRRKQFSHSERLAIFAKTGGRCYSCGSPIDFQERWWVEHINPVSRDGADSPDNLLPSCAPCNHIRSHNDPALIRSMLVVGEAMVREMQKGSKLGKAVRDHLDRAEARRKRRRKYPEYSLRPLSV